MASSPTSSWLDTKRAELNSAQRDFLDSIWAHWQAEGHWLPTRSLNIDLGRDTARRTAEALGGSFVEEHRASGSEPELYKLTTLGMLASPEGGNLEQLLTSYLVHLKDRVRVEPGLPDVKSKEVEESLHLSSQESEALRTLLFEDWRYAWNLGGGYGQTGWTATIPYRIDELIDARSVGPWFQEELRKSFDPDRPVWESERLSYILHARSAAPIEVLSFVANADLRRNLAFDLLEAEKALEYGLWKSCMVMSGSVMEGVLLDALGLASDIASEPPPTIAKGKRKGGRAPSLRDLLKAARQSGVLPHDLADRGDECRESRDLVHPEQQLRRSVSVSKLQASQVLQTAHSVIRELRHRMSLSGGQRDSDGEAAPS